MIIYSPLISDIVPAFIYNLETTIISIPFQMNPAVGRTEVKTMRLQIKDYLSSKIINLDPIEVTMPQENNNVNFIIDGTISYNINGNVYTFPELGQYYKLQIAYCDDTSLEDTDLTWSSASLGRCIAAPKSLYITDLSETKNSSGLTENYVKYKGIYERDIQSEPLYSYRFDLYNQYKELMETSEEQIWNINDDIVNETINTIKCNPSFTIQDELQYGQFYNLDFTITTVNGYTQTVTLPIKKATPLTPDYELGLAAAADYDDAYVILTITDNGIAETKEESIDEATWDSRINYDTKFTTQIVCEDYLGNGKFKELARFSLEKEIGKEQRFEFDIINYVSDFVISYENTKRRFSNTKALLPGHYILNYTLLEIIEVSDTYTNYRAKFELKQTVLNNINAQFVLERSESLSSNIWKELSNFSVGPENNLLNWIFKDFSVEHGRTYTYRLRQYNNGKFSTGIESSAVNIKFEDMFLTDGDRQLKVRFNPTIQSLKTTLQESKTETLGSQYPYFFKNATVNYKEIPISGLISYLMDENEYFMDIEDLGLDRETVFEDGEFDSDKKLKTTNLTDYNVFAERIFREKVVDWLNNGKPKLFRSPTEGNVVIRLMNTSLSPNTTVGRMLYTFSCTGYEIASTELEDLNRLGLMNLSVEVGKLEGSLWQGHWSELKNNLLDNKLYNIQNFKWTSTILENSDECFIILYTSEDDEEGTVIKSFTGEVKTPEDTIYYSIEFVGDMGNSYFEFEQLENKYMAEKDTFGTTETESIWVSYEDTDGTGLEINAVGWTIHYLNIAGSGSVTIDEVIIDLSQDVQNRYYYDIVANSITLNNASCIIYYTRVKE